MDDSSAPATPDATAIPNASRIYDYTLGGTHNFPADRAAAEYMFSLVPSTPKWVRMLRAFLGQAAQRLWDEGYTHFVDFASGLPLEDHVHHVLPGARVVYSDTDPYTLEQARELVGDLPNVLYLRHDVKDAQSLLDRPEVEAFLGGERRVVFGLSGVTSFLPPEEIARIHRELYEWAAPGSRLYVTYETKQPGLTTPRMDQFLDMFRQMKAPFYLFTPDQPAALSAPWRLPPGGLPPLREFLGLPEDHMSEEDREGVGLEFYAGILEKPE
jgi:hypothetical protein